MAVGSRTSILNAVGIGLAIASAAPLLPSLAEAQSRGTLQVSATVVDNKVSLRTLDATRAAISQWGALKATSHDDVTTLAQVSIALLDLAQQAAEAPAQRQAPPAAPTLVVRIDYAKN